jgi:TRAP-type uncharacterized transport system fused permease subunit
MIVYDTSLILISGTWLDTAYIVSKAVLSIMLWGAAAIGFMWRPLAMWERAIAMMAAFLLVIAVPLTDEIGFALSAIFFGWCWWKAKRG